jgi:hypothetical protein
MARRQIKENVRMYINLFKGNTEQENDVFVMGSFYEVYTEIAWTLRDSLVVTVSLKRADKFTAGLEINLSCYW